MAKTSKIYYINLESRPDRDTLIRKELEKTGIEFERIPAIPHKNGAIGCGLSHIKALEKALLEGFEDVIISEDDTLFESPNLSSYLGRDCNLILLSYHMPHVHLTDFKDGLARVSNAQTTSLYLVKRHYIPKLIENFKGTVDGLQKKSKQSVAIDQGWKVLQPDFLAAIPRIAKQRDCKSDIEAKEVSYGGFLAIGILSCEKYKSRRVTQNLSNCPFINHYFVGENEVSGCVSLRCGDHYEHLADKTYRMIEWHLDTYPHLDYLLKTDDDITFNFEKLHSLFVSVCLNKIDYAGHAVKHDTYMSGYHKGKTSLGMPLQKMVKTTYAAGGGYFLSRKAMELALKNKHLGGIYEDHSVGLSLQESGINPVHINIRDACLWK